MALFGGEIYQFCLKFTPLCYLHSNRFRPEGTPYTGGIYEFDVYFPQTYPSVPPKVKLGGFHVGSDGTKECAKCAYEWPFQNSPLPTGQRLASNFNFNKAFC